MNQSRITKRIPRCLVLVIGDFRTGAGVALSMRQLGARVKVAGIGTAAVKAELTAQGIDSTGVVRWRKQALEAALDRLPAADVVLFTEGGWIAEREQILEVERTEAAMDGRHPRPVLVQGDERYEFLRSPSHWAAFAVALAACADFEQAREFSNRQTRGHKSKDTHTAAGRGSGAAVTRRRNAG